MRTIRRTPRALAAVIATGLVLVACGDDDDTSSEATSSTGAADPAAGETGAFCDAALAIELAPEPDLDFETATEEEISEAVRTFGSDVMRPLADDVVALAPDDVAEELSVLSAAVDDLAAGDLEAFDAPDVAAADDAFNAFVDDECGWGTYDVTGADFTFSGLPARIDAGPTRFRFTNEGSEFHELLLLRRNPGTDMPVEELFELSEEEAFELVTPAGPPTFATPGGSESAVYDLEAGEYIALCMIPTGITGEDSVPAPDALPHAAHGMVAELTVG